MQLFKKYFELRTQQNESLSKLVEALKENNKNLRELLQQGKLNAKQFQADLGLLMNSMRHSSEQLNGDLKKFMESIDSSVRMRTTIESDKLEAQQKLIVDKTPTPADLTY